ncbi:putative OB-fold protein [Gordonia hydrophobica]|nr:putative OB-fold protein [Gordonia hydrophobica]
MAVAAGRVADPDARAARVVLVSRDFPLLEGGNGAVLLAGLALPADTPVVEVLGGGPAVLDQIVGAEPGTLIIGADLSATVGASALLTGDSGVGIDGIARRTGSLPVTARASDGVRHVYGDPRLDREVGLKTAVDRLGLDPALPVVAIAGAKPKDLGALAVSDGAATDAAQSASGVIRVIAAILEVSAPLAGGVVAVEQASASAAVLDPGKGSAVVARSEALIGELPRTRTADGNGIPISLAAYARAFEPKLRWEAAVFDEAPGIDSAPLFPPRARVGATGKLADDYRLEPLPRTGTVYTHTTIRIPVPDLPSPYTLAVVALDDSPVRVLLKVTAAVAGTVEVGRPGKVVMRRVAVRAGVPDYGYAFWPDLPAETAASSADSAAQTAPEKEVAR